MSLSADTVFELRPDGDDDNGGGFVDGASGTDYSRQASAQLTLTDLVCLTASTTLTSATGGFTAQMVGNLIHIISGTNFAAGWYEITGYTDTNTVTIDRTAASGGDASGGTGRVGGALGSLGGLGAVLANQAINGAIAWCRSGSYSQDQAGTNVPGGGLSYNLGLHIVGYQTTRGDLPATRPKVTLSGSADSSPITYASNIFSTTVANLEIDANNIDIADAIIDGNNAQYHVVVNVKITNVHTGSNNCGIRQADCYYCYVEGGYYGFIYGRRYGCISVDAGNMAFAYADGDAFCVADTAGADGFWSNSGRQDLTGCVAYNCVQDGFDLTEGRLVNCIAYGNGAYGFNDCGLLINCASGSNTSGREDGTAYLDINPITLTADPFVDAANDDFELNQAAGGGALLRSLGIAIPGQTPNLDIGAVQHADPAGGGAGARTIIVGGLRGGLS